MNGSLEEEIYMEIPEGFEEHGNRSKVCKLTKSLYGLKQSGKCWNIELDKRLKAYGLLRSEKDPCVYYKNGKSGIMLIVVYVDDLVLIAETSEDMNTLRKYIKTKSEVTELGDLEYFLKIESRKDERGDVYLSQRKYIADILARYGMENCKAASTPLDPGVKLKKCQETITEEERVAMERVPYGQAVGKLQYLVSGTRPDIAFAVSRLGQFSANPGKSHWDALKHVLRYLKGTKDYELKIDKEGKEIGTFCDADWASCADERKSHSGYLVCVGETPVIWRSIKQKCVSLSTQEAEYIALTECGKELQWITQLLEEVGLKKFYRYPVKIKCDNQAAIALASNPKLTSRSKHIDLKYHYVRNLVLEKMIHIEYVPTQENNADVLTKGLQRVRHQAMVRKLQLGNFKTTT
jgi:hypothetical protein